MSNSTNKKFMVVAKNCERRLPRPGDLYRHFKGLDIYVVDLAIHTETDDPLVIYRHGDDVWARPLEMFLSKVDIDKYPDSKQFYRLERVLPLNTKESFEFNSYVTDLRKNKKFSNLSDDELYTYILRHYFL